MEKNFSENQTDHQTVCGEGQRNNEYRLRKSVFIRPATARSMVELNRSV
jgi:hypothetical protein